MHIGIANPRWRGKRSRHSGPCATRNFTWGPWSYEAWNPSNTLLCERQLWGHGDVKAWKRFPHYWSYVWWTHWSFDVIFVVNLGMLFSKQSSCRWFETRSRSCDVILMKFSHCHLDRMSRILLIAFRNNFLNNTWIFVTSIHCFHFCHVLVKD